MPSIAGQGAIYNVIVKQTGYSLNTQMSAYVPATTYDCNFVDKSNDYFCYDLSMFTIVFLLNFFLLFFQCKQIYEGAHLILSTF